jgi:hypothetical protein
MVCTSQQRGKKQQNTKFNGSFAGSFVLIDHRVTECSILVLCAHFEST